MLYTMVVRREKFLEDILKFSHLLLRGLIKESGPNQIIFSTSSIEMYHYVVHNGSALWWKLLEKISKFSHLLIRGLIEGLSPH